MPCEWRIVAVREVPTPESMMHCETPDAAVTYWHSSIVTAPQFNPECESFAVLMLSTKLRIRGHHIVPIGSRTRQWLTRAKCSVLPLSQHCTVLFCCTITQAAMRLRLTLTTRGVGPSKNL